MFMEKTQYSTLSGCQLDLNNANENPSQLFFGCGSPGSKIYREADDPDYQHATEGGEPSQGRNGC